MNFEEIDPNFRIETQIDRPGLTFYNAQDPRFRVQGVLKEPDGYVRMPTEAAEKISVNVVRLNKQLSGGRVRFRCDSPYVAVSLKLRTIGKMSHFPLTGSCGCDLFVRENGHERFWDLYRPPYAIDESGYEGVTDFPDRQMRELTLNLPPYCGVQELYIGVSADTRFEPARDYTIETPVVFYGSSITQGGCVSRPGNTYQNMLARELDFNHINLGFSGNALGETAAAEYIAGLTMSAFVFDYDHNAPTPEHLEQTHESFFRIVREKNPELPVLLLTRPKLRLSDAEKRRVEIVQRTYQNALDAGDRNVYFVCGTTLMPEEYTEMGLIDNTHPSDLGFYAMAKGIRPTLEKMLYPKK